MNPTWMAFLKSHGAFLAGNGHINFETAISSDSETLHPLVHLTAFSVKGDDAAAFLQGQLTCDIKNVQQNRSSLAAYCNAKGRVISTLLVCKKAEEFVIVLPEDLADLVVKKLRMYVLRSKVTLESLGELCLLGLRTKKTTLGSLLLPEKPFDAVSNNYFVAKMPGAQPRFLIISEFDDAGQLWSNTVASNRLQPGNSHDWAYLDLSAGIPWFDTSRSEEYTPQMINIDKLGGISFNKGCYVGQEIVARTHYLGQAKRELYLAECDPNADITPDTAIISKNTQETAGKILAYQYNPTTCRLLLVLQSGDHNPNVLALNNSNQDKINIIPFQ